MRNLMKYDERRPHWLVFAEAAPEHDDWYRLMVENPCNGEISTISTKIIDLEAPTRTEEVAPSPPPPAP
ncbi:hypothetical protein HUU59_09110 [bacterium]|nr:hypothetical protein [bacterium]